VLCGRQAPLLWCAGRARQWHARREIWRERTRGPWRHIRLLAVGHGEHAKFVGPRMVFWRRAVWLSWNPNVPQNVPQARRVSARDVEREGEFMGMRSASDTQLLCLCGCAQVNQATKLKAKAGRLQESAAELLDKAKTEKETAAALKAK
jgi:hypothetical protein